MIGASVYTTVTNSYWTPETVRIMTSAGGSMNQISKMKAETGYTNWDFENTWTIDEDSIAYLKELAKPDSVNVTTADTIEPQDVTITNVEELVKSSSATFDVTARDEQSGIYKIDIYIDNVIAKTVEYKTLVTELNPERVTIEKIAGNTSIHEYYVVVTDYTGFTTTSDTQRFLLKPIPAVKTSSDITEYTTQDLQITMEADLDEGQFIQYRTSVDAANVSWRTYTEPFTVTQNQIIYTRVNDGTNLGPQGEFLVNNIDRANPEISGNYHNRLLTLNFTDNGTSGIRGYQYAILDRAPDVAEAEGFEYGEEIPVTGTNKAEINITEYGNNYVYVKVFDNAGNSATASFGDYYIPGTIVRVEMEKVAKHDEDIKLGGAKLEFNVKYPTITDMPQKVTTDEDGLAKFKIVGRELGEHSYIISETEAPKGYEKIDDSILKVEYSYFGEVLNVTSLSENVVVEKFDKQLIKLKIVDKKEPAPEFKVVVKAIDEYSTDEKEILLKDIKYKIAIDAESGEKLSLTRATGSDGLVVLDNLSGNGEIAINVKQMEGISGYIFNEDNESTLVIKRNQETEEIVVHTGKSDYDVEYEIDYKHRAVIIVMRNKPKEVQTQLSFNAKYAIMDGNKIIYLNLQGMEVELEQPYGFGTISGITDENGMVDFDGVIKLSEGDYVYTLRTKEKGYFEAKEIRVIVHYDSEQNITSIREITQELESIKNKTDEDEKSIYNNFILTKVFFAEGGEIATLRLTLEEKDRVDKTALQGITYQIISSLGSISLVDNGTTDEFGEISTLLLKQDRVTVYVQETEMIAGYILEPVMKKLVLDLNHETDFMEVNRELTDESLDAEIEPNTGRIIIKETSLKKVDSKDKANICFFISKADNYGSTMEGVEFRFQEEVTGLDVILVSDEEGKIEYHDFRVSEAGTYTFTITELKTLPGYKLWENPIILDITYEYLEKEDGEFEFITSEILVKKGYENIEYKYCDEYETNAFFQLDVYLDLLNERGKGSVAEELENNFILNKLDAKTQEPLEGVSFSLVAEYETEQKLGFGFITDGNGKHEDYIEIPEGKTILKLVETATKPGYVLDKTPKVIEISKIDGVITIEKSDIKAEIKDGKLCIEMTNETAYVEEEPPPEEPGSPGDPPGPGEDDPNVTKFDIDLINENKYNSNLRLEGSSFNVKIKQFNEYVYNKNVSLGRVQLFKNTMQIRDLPYKDDMVIEVKQMVAPLHHTLNLNIYRIYINRDAEIEEIYLNDINITDDIEVLIDNVKHKIIIKIKNEPSEFMVGVTKLDNVDPDIHLANAGFRIGKYMDESSADLRTVGFLETDETGYGSTMVSEYATNATVLYTLGEVKTPEGYNGAGTAGIIIRTDINGDIIDADLSKSIIFAQEGFAIKRIEGKYIEFEVTNKRQPLPTYSLTIEDENAEDREVKVHKAEYNIKVQSELGPSISKNVTTSLKGLATVSGLMGTGRIEITIQQVNKAPGYKLDTTIYKAVVDREVFQTVTPEGGNKVTQNIVLNSDTDEKLEIEINNKTRNILIKVTNEPEFGIYIEKVDTSDRDVKLNGAIFNVTSTENNNETVETDRIGKAFIYLGKPVTNKTVTYTITEVKPPLGFEAIDPIVVVVEFNSAGKIEEAKLLENIPGVDLITQGSSFKLRIDNREDSEYGKGERTFGLWLQKYNLKNDGITVENVVFDIFIRAEDGRTKQAIKISDKTGKILLNSIKGYGKITIELTELESATGYKTDNKTRTITLYKEKAEDKDVDILRLIPEETSDDLKVRVNEKKQTVYVDVYNDISEDVLGLAIVKEDSRDPLVTLPKAVFSIKDVETENQFSVETNGSGIGYVPIPLHEEPGVYTYKIKENIAPVGYEEIEEILTLQVTYDEDGKIEKAELLDGNNIAYIEKIDTNYLELHVKDEPKPGLEPFELVITKADWSDYQITIPDTLLSVTVEDKNEFILNKTALTDEDGNIYIDEVNASGEIMIDIAELMPAKNRRFDGLQKQARLIRDPETGRIKLEESLNVDTRIDNANRKVQIIVRNKELPGLFTIVLDKKDKNTLLSMAGVEFELQAVGYEDVIKGITDEEGRIEFQGLEMPEIGTHQYKLKEVKTIEGYKLLEEEILLDITFRAGNADADEDPIIIDTAKVVNTGNAEVDKVLPQYVKVNIFNEPEIEDNTYDIVIHKKELGTEIPIGNVKIAFKLEYEDGTILYGVGTTSEDGKIEIKGLTKPGKVNITLKELETVYGYDLDTSEKLVKLDVEENSKLITLEEKAEDLKVEITENLAEITLYNKLSEEIIKFHVEKFVTKLNEKVITTREPIVTIDENHKPTYTKPGEVILVSTGDILEFTIRVYNEGTEDGYATKVIDKVPEGLEFLEDNEVNKEYGWTKNGDILECNYLAAEEHIIKGFDETLDYKDIKIVFKVTAEKISSSKVITNIAKVDAMADNFLADKMLEGSFKKIKNDEDVIMEAEEIIIDEEIKDEIVDDEIIDDEIVEDEIIDDDIVEDEIIDEEIIDEVIKDLEDFFENEVDENLEAFIKENFVADLKENYFVYEEDDNDDDEKEKDEENKTIDVFNLEDDKEYIIKPATKTAFTLMLGLLILVACLFRNLEIYVLTDGEYKLVKKLRRGRFNKKVDLSKYFDEDEDLNTIKLVMKNRLNKVLGGDKLEIKLQKQEFKRSVDKEETEYIVVKNRTNREELTKEDDTELYEELDGELVEELDIEKELKDEKDNKEDNNPI
ncbi:MAG: hypothetical protein J6J60_08935 [Clostridia bacterium]|nr:hypothetical protein [Clostridia bacterium]